MLESDLRDFLLLVLIMSRGCWLLHLLLVWCSLELILIDGNAQSVTIQRVTPAEGDPVEGNVVELRCQATGLVTGNIIDWTRSPIVKPPEVLIARNGMSLDSRYTLDTSMASGAQNKIETLAFNATREDTAVIYGCHVRNSIEMNSTIIVSAQTLTFIVRYFPSAMYPICSPDGPFTGTTVNMSCTTELGNPAVTVQILTSGAFYVWTYDKDRKEQMRSLQLDVTAADDGESYECKITPDLSGSNTSPFTGMERSCTMGPIYVGPMTTLNTQPNTSYLTDTSESLTTPTPRSDIQPTTPEPDENTTQPDDITTTVSPTTPFPIAIIAGAAGGGGFLILVIIILLILYICKCGCFKKDKQDPSLWQTNIPLTESNENHEPWGKTPGSIDQDVEEMREINPTPGFIQVSGTEDALATTQMETTAGGDVMYAQPQKKSTFKEQNKDGKVSPPQGIDSSGVDAEDVGVDVDETGDGSSPVYGKVQKSSKKPHVKEEKMSEDDNAELWPSTGYDPEDRYTEIPNMADIAPGLKPTAVVKPFVHPTVSKPEGGLQSSPHSNDRASPSVGNKPNVKKFKPTDRSESQPPRGDSNPAGSPSHPIAMTPPSTESPPIEHHGNTSQDDHNEEASYAEVSHNHARPHEAVRPEDRHDITYAELDLNPPTSDALPQPQEDGTLYASIVME